MTTENRVFFPSKEQINKDNPHGTNWILRTREIMHPCKHETPLTGYDYCEYCDGYRIIAIYYCQEGYRCDYGYMQSSNTWDLWAN